MAAKINSIMDVGKRSMMNSQTALQTYLTKKIPAVDANILLGV